MGSEGNYGNRVILEMLGNRDLYDFYLWGTGVGFFYVLVRRGFCFMLRYSFLDRLVQARLFISFVWVCFLT